MFAEYTHILELLPLLLMAGGSALLALIYFTAQH